MPATPAGGEPLALVALGDSYTIGTGVRAEDRWPNQLARTLRPDVSLRVAANLAVGGARSAELIEDQLPQLEMLDADLVSVLIGVNDVVRRVSAETYRANVRTILDDLLGRVPADRILVISTPDYTLTPKGPAYGAVERQRTRIRRFNAILRDEAEQRGLPFVDISPVADRAAVDPELVAPDGLHPSAKQYAAWVELIAPVVREMVQRTT
jgi:acyl-CoA thioesterase I